MTRDQTYYHAMYERLKPVDQEAINEAYKALAKSLRKSDFVTPGDDRAEALVAAITEYVVTGNPADFDPETYSTV